MDQSGNLYGSALEAGAQNNGTVFELTRSEGGWIFSTLYAFTACKAQPIARDTAGSLYGSCTDGGLYGAGWLFKLTNSGGTWMLTDLYDFTGGSDGANPEGAVVFDSSDNLYGTAAGGGISGDCVYGCGVVWEMAGVGAQHEN